MKLFKKISCAVLALMLSGVILYTDILFSFPAEITMYTNQEHNSSLGAGVTISVPKDICASAESKTVTPQKAGEYEVTLKVGDIIPFRKVKLSVSEQKSLLASGQLIGLRIYNKGLIVTNLSPITSGGKAVCPAQEAGILPGDIILEINGSAPKTTEDVAGLVKDSTTLTFLRNNTIKTVTLAPAKDDDSKAPKLGIWVRDSTAGVGTMTYIDSGTGSYGALGHGISDSDTGVMFRVASGTIEKSSVVSVTKGKRGVPGEISGSFSSRENPSGTVTLNCEAGIFGKLFSPSELGGTDYPIGVMSQVETGDAFILSTVDGETREYRIRILRSMPFGTATKGLAIEVTDEELLRKTGGIIQGMSGSPIIQNGKLIGAVTHVLVNDPTRGYGIFIENMLNESGA